MAPSYWEIGKFEGLRDLGLMFVHNMVNTEMYTAY
jgi:hypothetical protein